MFRIEPKSLHTMIPKSPNSFSNPPSRPWRAPCAASRTTSRLRKRGGRMNVRQRRRSHHRLRLPSAGGAHDDEPDRIALAPVRRNRAEDDEHRPRVGQVKPPLERRDNLLDGERRRGRLMKEANHVLAHAARLRSSSATRSSFRSSRTAAAARLLPSSNASRADSIPPTPSPPPPRPTPPPPHAH